MVTVKGHLLVSMFICLEHKQPPSRLPYNRVFYDICMVTAKGRLSVSLFIFMIVFELVDWSGPTRVRSRCKVLAALSVTKKTPFRIQFRHL